MIQSRIKFHIFFDCLLMLIIFQCNRFEIQNSTELVNNSNITTKSFRMLVGNIRIVLGMNFKILDLNLN